MRSLKKIVAGVMAFAMLASVMPIVGNENSFISNISVSAVGGVKEYNNFTFIDDGNGGYALKSYIGSVGSITIPNYIPENGKFVTSIMDDAFKSNTTITDVTFDTTKLTKIGNSAFASCTNLKLIAIPDTVTTIAANAFSNCSGLTSINIPSGVQTISENTFYNCSLLSQIKFNRTSDGNTSIKMIDKSAFENCTQLSLISLPSTVQTISGKAFANTGLMLFMIPLSTSYIETNAFSDCKNLLSFGINDGNKNFQVDKYGVLLDNTKTIIKQYPCGRQETSYTIGDLITKVEPGAFRNCQYLQEINSLATDYFCVNDGVLYDKDKKTLLAYPAGKTNTSYSVPVEFTTFTTIGKYAFSGCKNLSTVEFDERISDVSANAFNGCKSVKTVRMAKSPVSIINESTFENCTSLDTIVFPNADLSKKTVSSISDRAFAGCSSLSKIDIPESVSSIGIKSFIDCSALTNITIRNSQAKIAEYAIGYITDVTSDTKVTVDSSKKITVVGYSNSTAATYCSDKSTIVFSAELGTAPTKGDVDGNGKVDAVDAALTLKYFTLSMTNKTISAKFNKDVADVDGNGKVDAVDAAYVLKYYTLSMKGSIDWSDIIKK